MGLLDFGDTQAAQQAAPAMGGAGLLDFGDRPAPSKTIYDTQGQPTGGDVPMSMFADQNANTLHNIKTGYQTLASSQPINNPSDDEKRILAASQARIAADPSNPQAYVAAATAHQNLLEQRNPATQASQYTDENIANTSVPGNGVGNWLEWGLGKPGWVGNLALSGVTGLGRDVAQSAGILDPQTNAAYNQMSGAQLAHHPWAGKLAQLYGNFGDPVAAPFFTGAGAVALPLGKGYLHAAATGAIGMQGLRGAEDVLQGKTPTIMSAGELTEAAAFGAGIHGAGNVLRRVFGGQPAEARQDQTHKDLSNAFQSEHGLTATQAEVAARTVRVMAERGLIDPANREATVKSVADQARQQMPEQQMPAAPPQQDMSAVRDQVRGDDTLANFDKAIEAKSAKELVPTTPPEEDFVAPAGVEAAAQKKAEAAGAKFNGVQETGDPENPYLELYTDPKTGSTVALAPGEDLPTKIAEMQAKFAAKNKPKDQLLQRVEASKAADVLKPAKKNLADLQTLLARAKGVVGPERSPEDIAQIEQQLKDATAKYEATPPEQRPQSQPRGEKATPASTEDVAALLARIDEELRQIKPGPIPEGVEMGEQRDAASNKATALDELRTGLEAAFPNHPAGPAKVSEAEPTLPVHRAAQKIAEAFGHDVTFYKSNYQNASGMSADLAPEHILINIDSGHPVLSVLGHELVHGIRKTAPDVFGQLQDAIEQHDPGAIQRGMDQYYERAAGSKPIQAKMKADPAKWREEGTANVMMEAFANRDFWSRLQQKQPTVFEHVARTVADFVASVKKLFKGGYGGLVKQPEAFTKMAEIMGQFAGTKIKDYDKKSIDAGNGRVTVEASSAKELLRKGVEGSTTTQAGKGTSEGPRTDAEAPSPTSIIDKPASLTPAKNADTISAQRVLQKADLKPTAQVAADLFNHAFENKLSPEEEATLGLRNADGEPLRGGERKQAMEGYRLTLLSDLKSGNPDAGAKLAASMMGTIRMDARRMLGEKASPERMADVMQSGIKSLTQQITGERRAVAERGKGPKINDFDPARGKSMSSFLYPPVFRSMQKAAGLEFGEKTMREGAGTSIAKLEVQRLTSDVAGKFDTSDEAVANETANALKKTEKISGEPSPELAQKLSSIGGKIEGFDGKQAIVRLSPIEGTKVSADPSDPNLANLGGRQVEVVKQGTRWLYRDFGSEGGFHPVRDEANVAKLENGVLPTQNTLSQVFAGAGEQTPQVDFLPESVTLKKTEETENKSMPMWIKQDSFDIMGEGGKLGQINIVHDLDSNSLHIFSMTSEGGPSSLGVKALMQVRRLLKAQYPDVAKVDYARQGSTGGAYGRMVTPSVDFLPNKIGPGENPDEIRVLFKKAMAEVPPRTIGRPELANPARTPPSRKLVDVIDELRKQTGVPEVKPDTQTQQEAAAIPDATMKKKLLDVADNGGQFNDAQTVAAKRLVAEATHKVVTGSGSNAEILEAVKLVNGYRRSGTEQARAFAARADEMMSPADRMKEYVMQAISRPAKKPLQLTSVEDQTPEEAVTEIGRVRDKLKDQGIDLDHLTDEQLADPDFVAPLIREIQASKSSWWDVGHEYWINSIFSGPQTHIVNSLSNAAHMVTELGPQRVMEAFTNDALQAAGLGSASGAHVGELKYLYQGLWPAITKASRDAVRSFSRELNIFDDQILPDEVGDLMQGRGRTAISGTKGRIVRTPVRLLRGADTFFQSLSAQMQVGAEAYRIGKGEKLKGPQLAQRMGELISNLQSPAWQAATEMGKKLTFKDEPMQIIQHMMDIQSDVPGVRWILPVIKTPAKIFEVGVRKSPLGALSVGKGIAGDLLNYRPGNKGNWQYSKSGDFAHRIAEQGIAWAGTIALHSMVQQGLITGSAGSSSQVNEGERDFHARTDPPNSIKLGGRWFSYDRIEPFATALSLAVDGLKWASDIQAGKEPGTAIGDQMQKMVSLVRDKTFLKGLGDIIRAAEDPAQGVPEWGEQFATSWVPNMIRQTARASDENVRDSKVVGADWVTWSKSLLNRTASDAFPNGSMEPPKVDLWGREITKDSLGGPPGTDFLYRLLSPFRTQSDQNAHLNDVDRMILNWNNQNPNDGWYPAPPPRNIPRGNPLEGKQTYTIPARQYEQFCKDSGQLAADILRDVNFNADKPDHEDMLILKKIISKARHVTALQTFGPSALSLEDTKELFPAETGAE